MKKIVFIYLFVFHTLLYGCATCQLMTPMAEISLKVKAEDKKLKNIKIEWKFSHVYSDEITKQYDKNNNQKLDEKELKVILDAMLDYLIPKSMLSKIEYAQEHEERGSILNVNYKQFDIQMLDTFLVFSYDTDINIDVKNNAMLSFSFEDDESFFSFNIEAFSIDTTTLHYTQNLYLFTASIFFRDIPFELEEKSLKVSQEVNQTQVQKPQEAIKTKNTKNTHVTQSVKNENLQENLLQDSITKIKALFESIKDEKNPFSYMMLLFFAYIYGVIHALGPGHGKTLVGSYFLSNERSYSKALFISLAIGVVHTFSAFLLTLVVYFVVDTFLAKFMDSSIFYTTKISALIIISIALYLLYQKYKVYKQSTKSQLHSFSVNPHIESCACNACKVDKNSTDMALIISAGIIPCPGTVTIFIFSLSLGLYYAGFMSALVMSLGMSTIIFFSALLSVVIRKKTSRSYSNLKQYLEYGSLIIILILGLFLLFI